MNRLAFVASLALFVAACSQPEESETGPAPRPVPTLTKVVRTQLASLAPEAPATVAPADEEEVRGLIAGTQSSMARMVTASEEAIRELGAAGGERLVRLIADESIDDAEKTGAIRLLGALGDRGATEALLNLIETSEVPWVRAHASWQLANVTDPWFMPRLILRLKYEKDRETVLWIVDTLAKHGNYSGATVLESLWADENEPEGIRTAAGQKLAELRALSGAPEDVSVSSYWLDDQVEPKPASDAYRHEVWRWIERLHEYQLRGVDDARFILERSDRHAASLLGRALSDEDRYIRVHACQCLARMGKRARVAEADMVTLLGDPIAAHEATKALGRVDTETAEAELLHEIQHSKNPEVQITAARALRWRLAGASQTAKDLIQGLADDAATLPELRQAALETSAYLGQLDRAGLESLVEFSIDPMFEADSSVRALEYYVATNGDEELVRAFHELAPQGGEVISNEERVRSRGERASLLMDNLDALFPVGD